VFVRFLKLIGTAVPDGLELHLICDNYATRKTPAIKKWLLPPVPPPTSSSRINLKESLVRSRPDG
jgi:hypothetical protein